jgi:cyanophycin synthetase
MGDVVYLKSTANLSTGGTSVDVTDMLHPRTYFSWKNFESNGLDVCGVDIMAENLTQPLKIMAVLFLK